jgi:hypothetical protein
MVPCPPAAVQFEQNISCPVVSESKDDNCVTVKTGNAIPGTVPGVFVVRDQSYPFEIATAPRGEAAGRVSVNLVEAAYDTLAINIRAQKLPSHFFILFSFF